MLINNKKDEFQAGNVVVLKLVTGEEIISKIDAVEEDNLLLYRPCALGMTANGPTLNKWIVFANRDLPVAVKLSSIMTHAVPDVDVRDHYESATSNIVKASADLLQT